jgi:hypothetical protein
MGGSRWLFVNQQRHTPLARPQPQSKAHSQPPCIPLPTPTPSISVACTFAQMSKSDNITAQHGQWHPPAVLYLYLYCTCTPAGRGLAPWAGCQAAARGRFLGSGSANLAGAGNGTKEDVSLRSLVSLGTPAYPWSARFEEPHCTRTIDTGSGGAHARPQRPHGRVLPAAGGLWTLDFRGRCHGVPLSRHRLDARDAGRLTAWSALLCL